MKIAKFIMTVLAFLTLYSGEPVAQSVNYTPFPLGKSSSSASAQTSNNQGTAVSTNKVYNDPNGGGYASSGPLMLRSMLAGRNNGKAVSRDVSQAYPTTFTRQSARRNEAQREQENAERARLNQYLQSRQGVDNRSSGAQPYSFARQSRAGQVSKQQANTNSAQVNVGQIATDPLSGAQSETNAYLNQFRNDQLPTVNNSVNNISAPQNVTVMPRNQVRAPKRVFNTVN